MLEEDGVPRDMDHRSSNPDKPLADPAGAVPEAGALFDAAEVDVRVTGVDVGVADESGCDDVLRVLFCADIGDIVAAANCLLLVTEESGFSTGAPRTGGEVAL